MNKKRFSKTHHKHGLIGEDFALNWFRRLGYGGAKPECQYGADLFLDHPKWGITPVEVERRYAKSWANGLFPYDTYNLPDRRYAKAKTSLLVVLSFDMDRALLVFPMSVLGADLSNLWVTKDNRHVKGERVLEVPVELCRDVSTSDPSVRIDTLPHEY